MEMEQLPQILYTFDGGHLDHIADINKIIDVAGSLKAKMDRFSDPRMADEIEELIRALHSIKKETARLVVSVAEQKSTLQDESDAPLSVFSKESPESPPCSVCMDLDMAMSIKMFQDSCESQGCEFWLNR